MTTAYIGQPINRVDGRAKVTGSAKYAAEHNVPNLAYGVVVSSAVARGRITRIDTADAIKLPGVLQVLTHENAPRLPSLDANLFDPVASVGPLFVPLQHNEIKFSLQPVALALADNYELARYAASLVRIEYEHEAHATHFEATRAGAYVPPKWRPVISPTPKPRGDAVQALAQAAVQFDAEYRAPIEHHNPMEPFATTVLWEPDGKFTIYDKNQGVQNAQEYVCALFDLPKADVRVLTPFMGGGFGSGLHPQYQLFLAVLAARVLKRPVRVSLTRQQMFSHSYRPITWQRVAVGAAADGALEAIVHDAVSGTSSFEDYSEPIVDWSGMLYKCDNVRLDYKVAKLDLNTPADMRAPGAAWGLYALECVMDELAVRLRMDPLELRLKNYAERDQNDDLPFSSKSLRECYRLGAERFGWSRRISAPRSMRHGDTLLGMGMATAAWEAFQVPASARCVLNADGTAVVSSATEDIGCGTYTVMTQIAADALGLPIDRVTFKLGDSSLSRAPLEGGSFTVASVGSAVKAACERVAEHLFAAARTIADSPIADATLDDVTFADGHIRVRNASSRTVSFTD